MKQLSFSFFPFNGEDVEDLKRQVSKFHEYDKTKRNWENAFQRWSNEQAMDGTNSHGICGYGSMCDWCEDNTYGRPCVRALNAMLREKGQTVDYLNRDFEAVWHGMGVKHE